MERFRASPLSAEAREECRRVLGFDVEEFFEEIARAAPPDVCETCLRDDPELRHRVDAELERAFGKMQGRIKLAPFFLARELVRRQVGKGLDLADRLVERFRKTKR